MSTVHISHHTGAFPGKVTSRLGVLPSKKRVHPKRTKIKLLSDSSSDGGGCTTRRSRHSPRLDPIAMTARSMEHLNNLDAMGPATSLALKRLPPVKVSYQSAKKFMESPRTDMSSRIIRPHLTLKTYSPGHHIFTEGISRSSELPMPTFALERVGVPYSNLPDNIAIHKEKDKFAFSVTQREEYDKSPYRLTPKPITIGNAQLIHQEVKIPSVDQDCDEAAAQPTTDRTRKLSNRSPFALKSNVIQLEPLSAREGSVVDSPPLDGDLVSPKEPLGLSYSYVHQYKKRAHHLQSIPEKSTDGERKLSVVSIGDSVSPDHFSRLRRETRHQYPMFDHHSYKDDQYRMEKFGHVDRFKARPQVPTSTFTYKVSSHDHSYGQESSTERFKPIKNNLRDRYGNPIHTRRFLIPESSLTSRSVTDYNFRRYYTRLQHSRSAGSGGSDATVLPGNPPPSEISHILSEEAAPPVVSTDLRNTSTMKPLIEERTMTASIVAKEDIDEETRLFATTAGEDTKLFSTTEVLEEEPPVQHIGELISTRTNITCTTTDTDAQFQSAVRLNEEMKMGESQTVASEYMHQDDESVYKYIAEAEERIKEETLDDLVEVDQIAEQDVTDGAVAMVTVNEDTVVEPETEDDNVFDETVAGGDAALQVNEVENNEESNTSSPNSDDTVDASEHCSDKNIKIPTMNSKPILSVPKFSLDDKLGRYPALPSITDRTSLSRKIQNTPVTESKIKEVTNSQTNFKPCSKDSNMAHVPITRLRLFSDASTASIDLPSVCVTDENGDLQNSLNSVNSTSGGFKESLKTSLLSTTEKRPVNNENVQFIYPSSTEIKAKRQ